MWKISDLNDDKIISVLERIESKDKYPISVRTICDIPISFYMPKKQAMQIAEEIVNSHNEKFLCSLPDSQNKESTDRINELTSEIERLKSGNFTMEEFQFLCHNLPNNCTKESFCNGCEEYQKKLFGSSPITELRVEITRLKKDNHD